METPGLAGGEERTGDRRSLMPIERRHAEHVTAIPGIFGRLSSGTMTRVGGGAGTGAHVFHRHVELGRRVGALSEADASSSMVLSARLGVET